MTLRAGSYVIDGVNIGMDVFGPLYGLAVQGDKAGILERIVGNHFLLWRFLTAMEMSDYVRMDVFFALSQNALTASFVNVKLAIGHPRPITMGFD